jgi:hypothetical protein
MSHETDVLDEAIDTIKKSTDVYRKLCGLEIENDKLRLEVFSLKSQLHRSRQLIMSSTTRNYEKS